ncbi:hypothetical protein ACFOWA_01890 [Pedobacter lithocola]|uniref:Uncharacterized protein n=1 Tax=Pedobacter lithocola TaxID=1908239 RepID=A0ABV8P4V0_9SPHI
MPSHNPPQPFITENQGAHTITSADIDQLTDVDFKAFIDELTQKASKISFFQWFGALPMIAFTVILSVFSLKTKETVLHPGGRREVVTVDSYVGCYIRVRADAGSAVLATAKNVEIFTLLYAPSRKWFKTKVKDTAGYIASKLAKKGVVNDPREVSLEQYLINPRYYWQLGLGLAFFTVLVIYLAKVDRKGLK